MKRKSFCLAVAFLAGNAPAALAIHYATSTGGEPVSIVTVDLLHRPVNRVSSCTSDSNTVAVGYDIYEDGGGFNILCADAGTIGFWSRPMITDAVGTVPAAARRVLCPSGTALTGLRRLDGLPLPLPVCGTLDPNFVTGQVLSHPAPPAGPDSCGSAGYVQSLLATEDSAVFTIACNALVTNTLSLVFAHVDLAVKTVNQAALLGHNGTSDFQVEVFNLGTADIPGSNVSLELHFNTAGWQLSSSLTCTNISVLSAGVPVVVGQRCTLPATIRGRGGRISIPFTLQPSGPESLRPPTPEGKPLVTVIVKVIDEHLDGADVSEANNTAAFRVVLR